MKTSITIALHDTNIFFVQGMRHILDDYFLAKGMTVRFTPANNGLRANLMVNSAFPWGGEKKIIKMTVIHEQFWGDCLYLQGTINRNEKPAAIVNLLDKLLTPAGAHILQSEISLIRFTSREQDVLIKIAAQLPLSQIARKMQLSVKTVSSHKHSAMRKLQLTSNQELYDWMLQSGMIIQHQNHPWWSASSEESSLS